LRCARVFRRQLAVGSGAVVKESRVAGGWWRDYSFRRSQSAATNTRHFFPRTALLARRPRRRFDFVTAVEIIAEIEHLPADERAKVVAFAQHLGESAMLSGAELSKLAGRLADGPHPAEAARLREELEKGFYGASSHA
jgi:hypothetical protein